MYHILIVSFIKMHSQIISIDFTHSILFFYLQFTIAGCVYKYTELQLKRGDVGCMDLQLIIAYTVWPV